MLQREEKKMTIKIIVFNMTRCKKNSPAVLNFINCGSIILKLLIYGFFVPVSQLSSQLCQFDFGFLWFSIKKNLKL